MPGSRVCQCGELRSWITLVDPDLACADGAPPEVGVTVVGAVGVAEAVAALAAPALRAAGLSSYCVHTGLPLLAGVEAQAAPHAESAGAIRTKSRAKRRIESPLAKSRDHPWTRQAAESCMDLPGNHSALRGPLPNTHDAAQHKAAG